MAERPGSGAVPFRLRVSQRADVVRQAIESLERRVLLAATAPIISEFSAANSATLADQFGEYSDWIEVHNPTAAAFNLNGWKLRDSGATWTFPSLNLPAGGYVVVFASDRNLINTAQPLHTNFKLSAEGEYLGLLRPDNSVAFQYSPTFPPQQTDITYGTKFETRTLLADGASAQVMAPSSGTLGTTWTQPSYTPGPGWTSGPTGVGFGMSSSGLTVKNYKANVAITRISDAETVIANSSFHHSVTQELAPVINYYNTDSGGNFPDDRTFPGMTIGVDADNFAIEATGKIIIPSTGAWSFGVSSDDGFRLTLSRGGTTFTSEFAGRRSAFNTIRTFNIPAAGEWDLRLVMFENSGGASVEMFAAPGFKTGFDSTFRLVGDTVNGGLAVQTVAAGAGANLVRTDIGAAVRNVNSSAFVRVPFNIDTPASFNSLTLNMRYDDGFVAYLNGAEVARRNAPAGAPAYNAAATIERPNGAAAVAEAINITAFKSNLVAGNNLLAVHGLNRTAADGDFLVLPELIGAGVVETDLRYFTVATPGAANTTAFTNYTQPVTFSVPHGFYTNAFPLALSTATPGATIRYTLDNSEPTATQGIVYTGPITVNRTMTLRAGAFKADHETDQVQTQTYLFLADVRVQSPNGETPPGWPSSGVNGQVMDYGMDPEIGDSSTWGPQLNAALTQIPSLSIVTDQANLTSSSIGIYVNAGQDGPDWEREASIELLNPDGSPSFTINGGLRIRGGFSRTPENPKHSLRLFFRDQYGPSKLKFPLFGDEGTDEFDNIDLRTAQNYSWSFLGDPTMTMTRDVFSRDAQREMGEPYTRSRQYHLYLNGQYWGIYMTQERANSSYAESYFGGEKEDYDVVKVEAGPYVVEATDGSVQPWNDLWDLARQDVSGNTAYYNLLGKNADGTDNAGKPVHVDVDNLINYMLVIYYGGNLDAPISAFLGNNAPNNFWAARNRDVSARQGWQFFAHDAEHTLLSVTESRLGPYPAEDNVQHFNPQWLHQRLMSNAEYRTRFADLAQKHLFNEGALTPQKVRERFLARKAEIETAIIAESARWGDSKTSSPLDKSHWESANAYVLNEFFPGRTAILIQQLRDQGWLPALDAPVFKVNGMPRNGGQLSGTDVLAVEGAGTVYYTLDGTDPRLPGGAINPNALSTSGSQATLIPRGAAWKYLDNGSNAGIAWRGTGFSDSTWASGNAELGYGDGDETTVLSYGADPSLKHVTTYFRRTINISNPSQYSSIRLSALIDDGAVIYINGQELARPNMPGGTIAYDTLAAASANEGVYLDLSVPASMLVAGNNVIAVEMHQVHRTSSDISFNLEMVGTAITPINLTGTKRVSARVRNGTTWSPLSEAVFSRDALASASNLAITELNYHPHGTELSLGETAAEANAYEYIEFLNRGTQAVTLRGVRFTAGITFQFDDVATLAAGQRGVIVRDVAAFRSRYGSGPLVLGTYTGSLDNAGEAIALVDGAGNTIRAFTYDDNSPWPTRADGNGSTLEVINPAGNYNDPANWRPSGAFGGTPGTAGAPVANVVINETVANPAAGQTDAIELFNTTAQSIDISGWFISDGNSDYRKFRIPGGTILAAGAYRVFNESDFNPGNGTQPTDFGLSSAGERVYLLQANPTTEKLLRFADDVTFGPSSVGQSLARLPNGSGPFTIASPPTLGRPNGADTQPTIISWSSTALHANGVGEVGLTVPDDNLFVESRSAGVRKVLVRFDRPVDPATFTPSSVQLAGNGQTGALNLSGIAISTSLLESNTLGVINFSAALPNYAKYLVRLSGVAGPGGVALSGDADRVFTALIGDVSGDGRVNATDLSRVRGASTGLVNPSITAQVRADVSVDGRANATDLSRVQARNGNDARGIPVPTGESSLQSVSQPMVAPDEDEDQESEKSSSDVLSES